MDDQLARCLVAEAEGWGYVVENRTEESIRIGIEKLLNHPQVQLTNAGNNGADSLTLELINRLEAWDSG
jgi:hypothetical protein